MRTLRQDLQPSQPPERALTHAHGRKALQMQPLRQRVREEIQSALSRTRASVGRAAWPGGETEQELG